MFPQNSSSSEARGRFSIQRALDIARNSEGYVDPTIYQYLERALQDVWTRLHHAPDTYIFTRDEFALLNYYRARFASSELAQRAVRRFWDNYQGFYSEYQQPATQPQETLSVDSSQPLQTATSHQTSSATMGGRHSSAQSQATISIENAQIRRSRGPSAVSMEKTWQQVTNNRQQQQFEQAWKVGIERAAHLDREPLARDESLSTVVSSNLTPILTLGAMLHATNPQRGLEVPFSCGEDLATATSTLRIVEDAVPNAISGDGRQMLDVAPQDNPASNDGTNMITIENSQESSPSPSMTSEDSDSDAPLNTELAYDVKTRLLEQLMAVFLKRYHVILNRLLSDNKVRRHQDGNQSMDSGATESTQATDHDTATVNAATREHKRPRNDDQDDDGRSGASGRKRPNAPRVRNSEEAADRLACPFFKRRPQKYQSFKSCPGPGWDTVHRLKEHLYRCHMQPLFCNMCGDVFSSDVTLREHQRSRPSCPIRDYMPLEGITQAQKLRLRSRKRAGLDGTESDKWLVMYRILFPDDDLDSTPTPYYLLPSGTADTKNSGLSAVEEVLRYEVPAHVRQELALAIEKELEPVEETLRQRLPGTILHIVLSTLFPKAPSSFERLSNTIESSMTDGTSAQSDVRVSANTPAQCRSNTVLAEGCNQLSSSDTQEAQTWPEIWSDLNWMINDAFDPRNITDDVPLAQRPSSQTKAHDPSSGYFDFNALPDTGGDEPGNI